MPRTRPRTVLAAGPALHAGGAIDPSVTQSDIRRTICTSGYTDRVRPPEQVTEAEKRASLRAYGDRQPIYAYEYDHVPLELGGARNDPRNLWPEPGASPNPKDLLENRPNAWVCAGQMTLAAAQRSIAHNWVAAYDGYVAAASYSVALNSQIAIPISTRPSNRTIAISSAVGTGQLNHVIGGASAATAAAGIARWEKTISRIGATA